MVSTYDNGECMKKKVSLSILSLALLSGCSQFGDWSNLGTGSGSPSYYPSSSYPSTYDSSYYENERLRRENDRLRDERDRTDRESARRNNPSRDVVDSATRAADQRVPSPPSVKSGDQQWLNQGLGNWNK